MIDIQKLRELEQAATPGPWTAQVIGSTETQSDYAIIQEGSVDDLFEMRLGGPIGYNRTHDKAVFVAARNALPELLDEVEKLRERVKALEDAGHGMIIALPALCSAPVSRARHTLHNALEATE